MPSLDEPSERPGCLPTSKDEPFLPSIRASVTSKPITTDATSINNSACASVRTDHRMRGTYGSTNDSSQEIYKASLKSYSSAPASESSTPFKLPVIDRSKSNSVSSLVSERNTHKSRGRSRDRRSRLCRSPSCPSNFWNEGPETPDTCRGEEGGEVPNPYFRPFLTHREEDGLKLPSIFQNRLCSNPSLNLSSSTGNSSHQNSRDTSPFSFRREATFINLSNINSHSHEGSISLASPPHNREDADNQLSRSGTQSSALLLPIQSGQDARNAIKAKRKRKKQNGLLNTAEIGSDAEKLLREKLGAIERRDNDNTSSGHEGEKTNLSDTTFIDKVQDENCLPNGASEPLTTKPPLYQNTPTRITTEKKVASVKA